MTKTVFRPGEAKNLDEKVKIPLFKDYSPPEEVVEEVVEEYTGPTADDLRREAELFKTNWETEKQQLIAQSQAEADEILKRAEATASEEVKRQTDEAAAIKANADAEAAAVVERARAEAEQILSQANAEKDAVLAEAKKSGYDEGREQGFAEGKAEAERLIERVHVMIEGIMKRREEILEETEGQIVELVILMARKVVKVLSESQKNVVMANTLAALKKVKARGKVTIRVNMEEAKLATANAAEFIKHVENVQGITVLEDSTVEKGGCIVETDFGAIDARISSQLTELETKILEVSPLKSIRPQDSQK